MDRRTDMKQPFSWPAYRQALARNPETPARFFEEFSIDHLDLRDVSALLTHFERLTDEALRAVNSLAGSCAVLRERANELETRH